MVSMEANVYQQTPMAGKKQVSGVPTVLFVDKEGHITEGDDIRNKRLMSTAVERGMSETEINSAPISSTDDSSIFSSGSSSPSSSMNLSGSGSQSEKVRTLSNPLPAVPAQVIPSPQVGGSPWAAFLTAARQAAPAVALLGAYGMMPSRSSGLGPARKTRRKHR